jgi:predicted PurR-regulated permease PerM
MSTQRFQSYFFIAVLVLSGLLTLLVFRSYLPLLAFGGALAVVARPLYAYLLKLIRSEIAAAFLTVIVVALTVVLPLIYFLAALSGELISLFGHARGFFSADAVVAYLERILPSGLHIQIPEIINQSLSVLRAVVEGLSSNLFEFFSNILGMFLAFVIILIFVYYLLKDGARIKAEFLALSPLGDDYDEMVLSRVIIAVRAVVNGVLVIGLIKGVLAGVFFWIFGVPAPFFWGTMTGAASFLPIFGSSLVTVPTIVYLVISGHYGAAIGLTLVSLLLIGTVDNFHQPKLVESKTNIHPLLILLSILGGLQFFGFAGFILGPLTLATTMALLDIYKKDFRGHLTDLT